MLKIDIEKINRANYRSCLSALSHPGKLWTIEPLFDSGLQALASLLLYSEVSYHYTGVLDFRVIEAMTGARENPVDVADYLFFDAPDSAPLQRAKRGTAENPDKGASLIFQCDDLGQGIPVTLSGPGIKDSLAVRLPVEPDFAGTLQEINANFPMGLDTFLVDTRGNLLGLPRTTRIEVMS